MFHVHHLTYANLGDEKTEDLMLLCQVCHEWIHRIKKEKGISIKQATDLATGAARLQKESAETPPLTGTRAALIELRNPKKRKTVKQKQANEIDTESSHVCTPSPEQVAEALRVHGKWTPDMFRSWGVPLKTDNTPHRKWKERLKEAWEKKQQQASSL